MTISWIKCPNNLPDDPRSFELEALLGTPRAWSHVLQLWAWVSRMPGVRGTGLLSDVSDSALARGAGWPGPTEDFISGLIGARFMDGARQLLDWEEVVGAYQRKLDVQASKLKVKRNAAKTAKASVGDVPLTHVYRTSEQEENRREKKRGEKESRQVMATESQHVTETHSHIPIIVRPEAEPRSRLAAVLAVSAPCRDDVATLSADVDAVSAPCRDDVATLSADVDAVSAPCRDDSRGPTGVTSERRRMPRGIVGIIESQIEPKTFEDFLAAPRDGTTAGAYYAERYPGFDGQNGRRTLHGVLGHAWRHYQAMDPRPPWPHDWYGRIDTWLERDYKNVRDSYARDTGTAPVRVSMFVQPGSVEAMEQKAKEPGFTEAEERKRLWPRYRDEWSKAEAAKVPWFKTYEDWHLAGCPNFAPPDADEPLVDASEMMQGLFEKFAAKRRS